MSVSQATSGFGCKLKRGDSGVGAGTKASKTFGSSNQTLKIYAKKAGLAGNSKTAGIVVAGVSTALSIVVTANSVLINSATDGSSAATTTVDHAIAALYQNATFVENFTADAGAGNGTGVLVAGTAANLSGGLDGGEEFEIIAEVKSISGPTMQAAVIDVTHMDSDNNTREFLSTLIDPGEMSFTVNFVPDSDQQEAMFEDLKDRVRRNYQVVFTNDAETTWQFAGIVTSLQPSADIEGALSASLTIKLTSLPEAI